MLKSPDIGTAGFFSSIESAGDVQNRMFEGGQKWRREQDMIAASRRPPGQESALDHIPRQVVAEIIAACTDYGVTPIEILGYSTDGWIDHARRHAIARVRDLRLQGSRPSIRDIGLWFSRTPETIRRSLKRHREIIGRDNGKRSSGPLRTQRPVR